MAVPYSESRLSLDRTTIAHVDVHVFSTEGHTLKDARGLQRPGSGQETKALLSITDSDGCAGYAISPTAHLRKDQIEGLLRPFLVGRELFSREALLADLYRIQRANQVVLPDRTLSRVDQALWDLQGRRLGLPVWRLLGGARSRVPAYGSTMIGDVTPGGLSDPAAYADFAISLKELGYRAIKVHSWNSPDGALAADIALCQAVRAAVGPDVLLMLDGFHWHSRLDALRLGRVLEELDFYWFEEPMAEDSMSSYQWLSDQLRIPVIGPETISGRNQSRAEWIQAKACDILRVGPLNGAGITPCLKTMHTADSFGMNCEVHGAGAATLALVGAMHTSRYYERGLLHPGVDYEQPPPHLNSIIDPMDADGMVIMPTASGLGEDLNLDYILGHTLASF